MLIFHICFGTYLPSSCDEVGVIRLKILNSTRPWNQSVSHFIYVVTLFSKRSTNDPKRKENSHALEKSLPDLSCSSANLKRLVGKDGISWKWSWNSEGYLPAKYVQICVGRCIIEVSCCRVFTNLHWKMHHTWDYIMRRNPMQIYTYILNLWGKISFPNF